jgi:hypothetical protein
MTESYLRLFKFPQDPAERAGCRPFLAHGSVCHPPRFMMSK